MTAPTLYRTDSVPTINWPDDVPPSLAALVEEDKRITGERHTLMTALKAAMGDERGAAQRDVQAKAQAVRSRTAMPDRTHVQTNALLVSRLRSDLNGVTEAVWQVRQEIVDVLHQERPAWLASLIAEREAVRADLKAAADAYIAAREALAQIDGTVAFVQRFPQKPSVRARTEDITVNGGSLPFVALAEALTRDAVTSYGGSGLLTAPGIPEAATATVPDSPEGLTVTSEGVLVMPGGAE